MRRYEPKHVYFDQWDEYGSIEMVETKDGRWTKVENMKHVINSFHKQLNRLKNENEQLKIALEKVQK